MIIHGNMRYSPSGRKRKTKAYKKARKPSFKKQSQKSFKPNPRLEEIKAHQEKYPSLPMGSSKPTQAEDNSYKQEISKQYTVAIPYNKGAYQVVPNEDIKNIGK
tara:strand:+ start:258 stop:569 length:312 start_codon:yes stop_codon:yes gene_type:complete